MEKIHVETLITKPIEEVWDCFTGVKHITGWNYASSEWHCPEAQTDLREGGRFCYRMAAKDGSMAFDFEGTFTEIEFGKKLSYTLDDQRKVEVLFSDEGGKTRVSESFEPESMNSPELQQAGWQAILDNFKQYCEQN